MNNLKNKVGYGSSELIIFRKKENILNEYLFFLLQTETFKKKCIATMTGTGGLKRVSNEFVKTYSLYIPSISEQEKIIEYLNKKTEKIMKLILKKENIIEELERYKKSLIYEYVTGKKQVI